MMSRAKWGAPHRRRPTMCNPAGEPTAHTNQSFRPTVASCTNRRTALPSRLHQRSEHPLRATAGLQQLPLNKYSVEHIPTAIDRTGHASATGTTCVASCLSCELLSSGLTEWRDGRSLRSLPMRVGTSSGSASISGGYGANKVAAELTLRESGLPVSILRPSRIRGTCPGLVRGQADPGRTHNCPDVASRAVWESPNGGVEPGPPGGRVR